MPLVQVVMLWKLRDVRFYFADLFLHATYATVNAAAWVYETQQASIAPPALKDMMIWFLYLEQKRAKGTVAAATLTGKLCERLARPKRGMQSCRSVTPAANHAFESTHTSVRMWRKPRVLAVHQDYTVEDTTRTESYASVRRTYQ